MPTAGLEDLLAGVKAGLREALPELPDSIELTLARPPRPELGDLAVTVFPFARALRSRPDELARRWAAALPQGHPLGPLTLEQALAEGGFLNLRFETASLLESVCGAVVAEGAGAGQLHRAKPERAMVEYSSPNTNKPLHLGHLRNNAIGMSLANLLEAGGYEVIRTSLVNDRGIHICKSMLAYTTWGGGETPESTGEKGDHFVGRYYVRFDAALREERAAFFAERGIDPEGLDREGRDRVEEEFLSQSRWMAQAQEILRSWEEGDGETLALWRRMNEWVYEGFRQTYDRLGCRFDRWYLESETWMLGKTEVERGLASGVFYRKPDGSVWAGLEQMGLQDKLLLRADGTSVYITQDLGTAVQKQADYQMGRSIYVVGQEQTLHFKNLFAMLRLLGHPWAEGCHHLAYALVNLPRGLGRLKSREGTAVDVDDLLDLMRDEARQRIVEGGYCDAHPDRIDATAEMIGQGALKVYLLQVGNDKTILFDPNEKLSFEGDTGPAIQYSHARICGILRKGIERGAIDPADLIPAEDAAEGVYRGVRSGALDLRLLDAAEERDLALLLLDLPQQIALGCRQLSAAPIANYLLDLTRTFARFYHAHRVLDAPAPPLRLARLHLCLCVAQVLRRGLRLLTVEAPDRM